MMQWTVDILWSLCTLGKEDKALIAKVNHASQIMNVYWFHGYIFLINNTCYGL